MDISFLVMRDDKTDVGIVLYFAEFVTQFALQFPPYVQVI